MLGAVAVITNCALLCLSPRVRPLAPSASPVEWVLIFVLLEHIILCVKMALMWLVPDEPLWVREALEKINYQSKLALRNEVRNMISCGVEDFFFIQHFFFFFKEWGSLRCECIFGFWNNGFRFSVDLSQHGILPGSKIQCSFERYIEGFVSVNYSEYDSNSGFIIFANLMLLS